MNTINVIPSFLFFIPSVMSQIKDSRHMAPFQTPFLGILWCELNRDGVAILSFTFVCILSCNIIMFEMDNAQSP